MDRDFEIGTTFRDQLVPLALEYYLGVIVQERGGEDYDEEDEADDDQEEQKSKKPSK